ncbi:MAG: CHAT domain-containing protein [Rhizobiales bacterium]|nr:CHAT domain-containing protein [Hyphomicrobiales bacterium]
MKYTDLLIKGLLLLLLVFSTSAQASKRVALIIGNSNYENVEKLKNPANDAKALAETLQNIGFDDVTLKLDLGNAALQRTLGQFAKRAAGADIAMLYFAGHGIEVGGTNFVIPVDAKLSHVDDVDFEAVDLSKIMRALNRASKLKLVVLDACRNNPFSSTMQRDQGNRSVGRGLSRVNLPGGKTLVAYAAKEGTVAADGAGQNSP